MATLLAEATTKLAEARTRLREAADGATWPRGPTRWLKDLQQAALEKAQVEVDGRESDVLAAEGKCVALESDVAAALRAALLVKAIRGGDPAVARPDDPRALRARCDQMARATEEPSKLESEESIESSEAESSEAESSEDFGPSAAAAAAAEEEKGGLSLEPEPEPEPVPDRGLDAQPVPAPDRGPGELETAGLTTSVAAAAAEEEKGGMSAAAAAVAAAAADVVGPAGPRASQGSTGRGRGCGGGGGGGVGGGGGGGAGLRPGGRGGRGEMEAGGRRRTFDPGKRSR